MATKRIGVYLIKSAGLTCQISTTPDLCTLRHGKNFVQTTFLVKFFLSEYGDWGDVFGDLSRPFLSILKYLTPVTQF